jgi:hypothetical protein
MKNIRLLMLTALLLVSCRTLPTINPVLPQAEPKAAACPSVFLQEPYRLIHAIEFRLAGNTGGAIIGVTVADPATRFVSCAIMTVEGLVLFEAEAGSSLKIVRALAPFDSPELAENLIEDIRLIFFAPRGNIHAEGVLPDGAAICRWREKSGDWIDVIARRAEGMEINKYSSWNNWKRRIRLSSAEEHIYRNIELAAQETFNYSLRMTLIEAETLAGSSKK